MHEEAGYILVCDVRGAPVERYAKVLLKEVGSSNDHAPQRSLKALLSRGHLSGVWIDE